MAAWKPHSLTKWSPDKDTSCLTWFSFLSFYAFKLRLTRSLISRLTGVNTEKKYTSIVRKMPKLANKIATQWLPDIIIKESKQTIHYIFFNFLVIMSLIWSKKLELCLKVASVLLKIKFGHAQIDGPKISILVSKTACINPWLGLKN